MPSGGRRKIAHACKHCQESHLVCDDGRPCKRCAMKGIECVEGARKKVKYMQEGDDQLPPHHQELASLQFNQTVMPPSNLPFAFSSDVINMEYIFLSSLLDSSEAENQMYPNNGATATTSISNNFSTPIPLASLNPTYPSNVYQQHSVSSGFSPQGSSVQQNDYHFEIGYLRNDDVYRDVVRPYDYREGFHYLIRYINERMDKSDFMRICKALAQFRPSFMAQIMNLSSEDLIFMEKCFQRTLMEFDKLIGFSGTPTVVWRRTGEIQLVGKEFSLLTQWTREQLLGKKTYIYELMDSASVVEYWEKFSAVAFDSSHQSCTMTATLIRPSNTAIRCAFCFTIKRDIFDIPLMVIGNFLPLFKSHT